MRALDPHPCTRCERPVAPEDTDRPEWVTSRLFAPVDPRPLDGAAWWQVTADTTQSGTIAALLCPDCALALRRWLYLGRALPALPALSDAAVTL